MFWQDVKRALWGDPLVFEDLATHPQGMEQAMGLVFLLGLATGIPSVFRFGVSGLVAHCIFYPLGWFVWSSLIYWVGCKWLAERQVRVAFKDVLVAMALAGSPALFRVLGIIPGLNGLVNFVVSLWMFWLLLIAVHSLLQSASWTRTVAVCVLAWGIQVCFVLLALPFGSLR